MINLSLTFRLAVIFSLVIILSGAAISISLYQTLQSELLQRDEQTLVNRASQLRHLLLLGADIDEIPLYFSHMLNTCQDVLLIELRGKSDVVINNPALKLPELPLIASESVLNREQIYRWNSDKNIEVHALKLQVMTPQGEVFLTVARQGVEREEVLQQYKVRSLYYLFLAILTAVTLSPLFIQRGLKSLHTLSNLTITTESSQLHQPLNVSDIPIELQPLVRAMNTMRQRLNQDFIRMTGFADDLAHEIRTPLHILLGQNQVALGRTRSSSEYQHLLAENIDELSKLSRLTEQILLLARMQHGEIALNNSQFDLHQLVDEMFEYLEPLAEIRNHTFICTGVAEIYADRLLIQRALDNILVNALNYSPEGSLIKVRIHLNQYEAGIKVESPGQRIIAGDQMFERFWRGDNARHTAGTGLGLALVKSIAELHKGSVGYVHHRGSNGFSIRIGIDKFAAAQGRSDDH